MAQASKEGTRATGSTREPAAADKTKEASGPDIPPSEQTGPGFDDGVKDEPYFGEVPTASDQSTWQEDQEDAAAAIEKAAEKAK